jgi:hypothetical protein
MMMLSDMPMYYAGGGFPWELLIIGGILYFVWRSGMFGGPGRHGQRYDGYGAGNNPSPAPQGSGSGQGDAGFRGPRTMFDDWHRQAHETSGAPAQAQAPVTPAAPPAPPTATAPEATVSGGGEPPATA